MSNVSSTDLSYQRSKDNDNNGRLADAIRIIDGMSSPRCATQNKKIDEIFPFSTPVEKFIPQRDTLFLKNQPVRTPEAGKTGKTGRVRPDET